MAITSTMSTGSAVGLEADGASESSRSAVSWAAIFAGAFIAIASALALIAFGAGIGFASISPWAGSGVSATTFTVSAAIWLIIVQWLSSALGAYVTGRLRTKWVGIHTDEITFRDTAHGLLTWSVAAVFGAFLLASATTSIIGGAASVTATAAGSAAGQTASSSDPSAYFVDSMFRGTQPAQNGANADPRPEATRILAVSLKNGSVAPADKTYLAQMISARTGISQPDAEKRIDDTINQAKATADAARKNAAKVSIYTFFSMLVGAFIAAVAGAIGGRARDA
jgi:hypothetical protein